MLRIEISPAIKYFFKKLEKKSDDINRLREIEESQNEVIPFDEVEKFARAIMTQNIFIHTVGVNGKHESTILSKAMFSINKVVRLYYSTSFDEARQGFLRLRTDHDSRMIIVERLHGLRPEPELLYASHDECHVIRFFISWLIRRIDWSKTKLENLDLYKRFVDVERQEVEQRMQEEQDAREAEELQKTLDKHFGEKIANVRR